MSAGDMLVYLDDTLRDGADDDQALLDVVAKVERYMRAEGIESFAIEFEKTHIHSWRESHQEGQVLHESCTFPGCLAHRKVTVQTG